MASQGWGTRVRAWLTTQQNLVILAAIAIALPTAYLYSSTFGGRAGDFLLLFTLAVGVPQTYATHWQHYDRTWMALAWVVAACAVATGAFVALYLFGTEVLRLSPFLAGVGAFLVTYLGTVLGFEYRRR